MIECSTLVPPEVFIEMRWPTRSSASVCPLSVVVTLAEVVVGDPEAAM